MNWNGTQFCDMAPEVLAKLRNDLASEMADITGESDLAAARKRQLERAISEIDLVGKP